MREEIVHHVWKATAGKAINRYWYERLRAVAPLYPSLKWLACDSTQIATRHPLIESIGNLREVPRIAVYLKIVTGTYKLQTNMTAFNQNVVDPTCMLCKTSEESLNHFLLECTTIESIRQPILRDMKHILRDSAIDFTDRDTLLQLITDCSAIVDTKTIREIIFHSRRLCYASHIERYQRLSIIPRRKRNKKAA